MIRTVEIPMKAIGKARPRFGNGRTWTPLETKAAENVVACAWKAKHGTDPLQGPVRIEIRAEYAPPASWSAKRRQQSFGAYKGTKPDADNVLKLVGDALNGLAYRDDALIADASFAKVYGPQDMLKITVEGI